MRLYSGKVGSIAKDIVRTLLASEAIEAEDPREVERDIESVMTSYLQVERDVNDKTRELLQRTGRGQNEFSRVRAQIAESHGIKVGDEMLDYLLDQVVEMLMHSQNVDEVYCEDVELRRAMRPAFRSHLAADAELDAEVRAQLKHVKEGTHMWDIEYARALETVKRRKGLG